MVEPQAGRHFTGATPNRSARQFARVVQRMIAAYPRARTIHVVMDNLNIHCEKSLTDHLGHRRGRRVWRRLTVHFTPKHGSWLNQAEIELSLVSRGCLGHRGINTLAQLRGDTRAWNTRANRAKTRIRWRFTRREARKKFGYQRNISNRSKTSRPASSSRSVQKVDREAGAFADSGRPRDVGTEWVRSAQIGVPDPKQPISFRVDLDVLDFFKAQGPRYQTRMNAVLRAYMTAHAGEE